MEQEYSQYPVESGRASSRGVSQLDELAAKAMQAQLTALWSMETYHGWSHEEIAVEAYKMADAMMAERLKRSQIMD